jgi:hypothetical protein
LFSSILKQHKLLFALGVVVVCVAGGFVHASTQDPQGPPVGGTIDLLSFRSRSGRTLADVMKQHSLAMVLLVDPSCETCATSKDSLKALREVVEKAKIAYYVVMIPDSTDTEKYFAFAESLNLGVEAFVWSNAAAKPPASLATMSKPSHLHVTSEGLIVRTWAGIPEKISTP